MASRIRPISLEAPVTKARWFEEPELSFAGGAHNVDPKTGISAPRYIVWVEGNGSLPAMR